MLVWPDVSLAREGWCVAVFAGFELMSEDAPVAVLRFAANCAKTPTGGSCSASAAGPEDAAAEVG